MTDLHGKVALITGASSGIGRAAAIALAQVGSSVIINYKSNQEAAEAVLAECDKLSKGNMVAQADVSDESSVSEMFAQIKDRYAKLDILVNNAGIFDESDGPESIEAFDKIYRNNFLSAVLVTKAALGLMKTGKIVNVSSIHGRQGYGRPEAIAYSAFKAALNSYTLNLAKSLAPDILVNAVAPGRVLTPMWGEPSAEDQSDLGKAHLIDRMIRPEEVADSIVFLAKNDAMCGEILTIDGGMSLVTLG